MIVKGRRGGSEEGKYGEEKEEIGKGKESKVEREGGLRSERRGGKEERCL